MSNDWEYLVVTRVFGSGHNEDGRETVQVEVCEECGVLVYDETEHEQWHERSQT